MASSSPYDDCLEIEMVDIKELKFYNISDIRHFIVKPLSNQDDVKRSRNDPLQAYAPQCSVVSTNIQQPPISNDAKLTAKSEDNLNHRTLGSVGKKERSLLHFNVCSICLVFIRRTDLHYTRQPNHFYGAKSWTCWACRHFFRRNARKAEEDLTCIGGNDSCPISWEAEKRRNACIKCRLKKCLNIGMRPQNVLTQEEISIYFKRSKSKSKKSERFYFEDEGLRF